MCVLVSAKLNLIKQENNSMQTLCIGKGLKTTHYMHAKMVDKRNIYIYTYICSATLKQLSKLI